MFDNKCDVWISSQVVLTLKERGKTSHPILYICKKKKRSQETDKSHTYIIFRNIIIEIITLSASYLKEQYLDIYKPIFMHFTLTQKNHLEKRHHITNYD